MSSMRDEKITWRRGRRFPPSGLLTLYDPKKNGDFSHPPQHSECS